MRRAVCVTGWLMVGALAGPGRLAGQAALPPADSAILNSQPLKRLVLAPSLLRRLSLLAAGLDREVVLCLQGTVVGDTALLRECAMPDIVPSSVAGVTPLPCPPATTLAVWHNHPWVGPDSSFGLRTPEDLCSLSQPDLRTVVADSIPFAVVSVGRAAQPIVCWWRRGPAGVNPPVEFLPRVPRPWLPRPGAPRAPRPPPPPPPGPLAPGRALFPPRASARPRSFASSKAAQRLANRAIASWTVSSSESPNGMGSYGSKNSLTMPSVSGSSSSIRRLTALHTSRSWATRRERRNRP